VAKSSSTKKAAKLANTGRTKSVRFQGGTLFPFVVALVLVLGLGTIVYARQTQPAFDTAAPSINDHWHAAYGFYICGEWYQLQGDLEDRNSQGQFVNTQFLQTGIHSHNDGVIHWHPYTSRAVGKRATLGVFLDVYNIELDNNRLDFPDNQPDGGERGAEYVSGEDRCDGDPGELSVVVWNNYADTGSGTRYIANFSNIRVQNDAMVFAIAFVPRNTPVPMPPWAQDLPTLGAVDMTGLTPEDLLGGDLLPDGFDESIFPEPEETGDTGDTDTGDTDTGDTDTGDTDTGDTDTGDTDTGDPAETGTSGG
jgi:hypothetical protein